MDSSHHTASLRGSCTLPAALGIWLRPAPGVHALKTNRAPGQQQHGLEMEAAKEELQMRAFFSKTAQHHILHVLQSFLICTVVEELLKT